MRTTPKHRAPRQALDLTHNTHFYCILTDLIDSLWSIVKKSFARNPVVFSQLHSILGKEQGIRKEFKTVLQEKKSSREPFNHHTCSRKRILAGNSLLDIKERIRAKY